MVARLCRGPMCQSMQVRRSASPDIVAGTQAPRLDSWPPDDLEIFRDGQQAEISNTLIALTLVVAM